MAELIGISQEGLETALEIKENYKQKELVCVPGEKTRILIPEYLMNHDLNLHGMEDPLPLALMAVRDPEAPMALAAATRLSPVAPKSELITGVFAIMGETTRHPLVKQCVKLITENAFSPDAIAKVRRQTSRVIIKTREEYTLALRHNLHGLMDGAVAPRQFVHEFFELTEAGNMRNDIRKKLVLSLLLSDSIRPSIKFMMLENFQRMPKPVRMAIISAVLKAEPTRHIELIKEELRWILTQERISRQTH
ncbi:MAG: hypothetical protein ISR52_06985 [Rhodospirillales bacterium]|nr:hypothetical protein [Rhodospirillales bacterium]